MNTLIMNLKSLIIPFVLFLFVTQATAQNDAVLLTGNNKVLSKTEVVSSLQEGAAIVQVEGKYGFVNEQGQKICRPIYDEVHLYSHGYAAVKKHNKWSYINKLGKRLTALRYDWVSDFDNGIAIVQHEGKWGLLNEQGFEVVATEYDVIKKDKKDNFIAQKNGKNWESIYAISSTKINNQYSPENLIE
jgi:hypothetical protein